MDISREPIKIEQMKAALDHGYEVLVIVNGCHYIWEPENNMTTAEKIEKSLNMHIENARNFASTLKTYNSMFKAEPLALDIMAISEMLGRAAMLCDILRVDFGKDTKEYTGIIQDIKNKAYETYKELTGGI